MNAIIEKIESFAGLKPNWDSYGGLPIDPKCITEACRVVQQLAGIQEKITACPTGHGGVQLEWSNNGVEYDVEILPETKGE